MYSLYCDTQLNLPCMRVALLFPRRPYERLLRKLLSMPNSPAVLLLHAYAWFKEDPAIGTFYSNAERDLNELAAYYQLPVVSVKGCCFEAMQEGVPGFQVSAQGCSQCGCTTCPAETVLRYGMVCGSGRYK